MNKILVVARREYTAAVKTKAFLISLVLMPIMMLGGIVVQKQTQSIADTSTYKVAILDRTEGATLAAELLEAAAQRQAGLIDKATGKATGPTFELEVIPPAPLTDPASVDRQRLELSERTRSKAILAFVEIGEKVNQPDAAKLIKLGSQAATQQSADASMASMQANLFTRMSELPDEAIIRYSTNQPTLTVFRDWLQRTITQPVAEQRMMKLGVSQAQVLQITDVILPPPVVDRGMARTAADGSITYESSKANVITNMLLPIALVMLMFIAVMVGASPLATNIVEEKQLRIAEVLLGGLRPFELMFGKLLGGAATAVTLASIYFLGIFFIAQRMDILQYVRGETIAWFVLFTLIGVMMYGSLFVAAGAAVTTMKEAQTTLTPVMLVVAMPFFVLTPIVQYPNGMLAKAAAFFPLTAPSVSIIRAAIPSGAQRWEMIVSAASAMIGMLVVVWIAGRIFRAGMLLTSKPASFREAIRWVVSG